MQRTVSIPNVWPHDFDRVRRIAQKRSAEFANEVIQLTSAYDMLYGDDEDPSSTASVGLGVYYFEE